MREQIDFWLNVQEQVPPLANMCLSFFLSSIAAAAAADCA
jgi:hypothetical protein